MNKLILSIATIAMLTSCADSKTINGVTYRPYGVFNESTQRNDLITYQVSPWAVVSGIVFSEVFFIPTIYTFGFNLMEPVCLKTEGTKSNGVIKK